MGGRYARETRMKLGAAKGLVAFDAEYEGALDGVSLSVVAHKEEVMVQMRRLSNYQSVVPLLLRLAVGSTFFFAGLGKVMGGTAGVAGFFGSLGIPLPGLMAPFISYLELLGGLALILGLFTRGFSLLLMCNMIVAILLVSLSGMAEAPSVPQAWNALRTELLLGVGALSLALLGPGRLSLDAALLGDTPEVVAEPIPVTPRASQT